MERARKEKEERERGWEELISLGRRRGTGGGGGEGQEGEEEEGGGLLGRSNEDGFDEDDFM